MSEVMSPFVMNASQASFKSDVLERSRELPVLVDFWAPWCAPCRQLGPRLEKLAQEFNGRFILVKVNTEEHPYLAQEYQVHSIPHVMVFRDGRPADGFVGLYPEAQIRALLERYCPNEADRLIAEARAKEEAGDAAGAETLYRKVLEIDSQHVAAHLAEATRRFCARSANGQIPTGEPLPRFLHH